MTSGDLISTAAIIVGFSITVVMFRLQRELYALEVLKIKILWLAWADYLVLASVALAVLGVLTPLLLSTRPERAIRIAAPICAAAVMLQAGYIPAILAHYRIEIDAKRQNPRAKGEPVERIIVIITVVAATVAFGLTFVSRMRA